MVTPVPSPDSPLPSGNHHCALPKLPHLSPQKKHPKKLGGGVDRGRGDLHEKNNPSSNNAWVAFNEKTAFYSQQVAGGEYPPSVAVSVCYGTCVQTPFLEWVGNGQSHEGGCLYLLTHVLSFFNVDPTMCSVTPPHREQGSTKNGASEAPPPTLRWWGLYLLRALLSKE